MKVVIYHLSIWILVVTGIFTTSIMCEFIFWSVFSLLLLSVVLSVSELVDDYMEGICHGEQVVHSKCFDICKYTSFILLGLISASFNNLWVAGLIVLSVTSFDVLMKELEGN